MDEAQRPDFDIDETQAEHGPDGEPREALTLKNSFGTAVGAAMLGFEQALRREPPAEVLAAEHMPERDHAAHDARGEVIIESPETIERA